MIVKHPIKKIILIVEALYISFFYDAFVCMDLPMSHLRSLSVPLVGFIGDLVGVKGVIILLVMAGTPSRQSTVITFTIVHLPSTTMPSLADPG